MATASAKRRARRTAVGTRNEFRVPPKECEMCGAKMSGKDKHRACVLCLGPNHALRGLRERGAFCLLCGDTETRYLRRRLFRSRERQDFASDLSLAIIKNKDQESGPPEPIPQLAQCTSPARSWGLGMDYVDRDLLLQTENHAYNPSSALPVFTKGASITTMSSLINQLKGITDPIIGLHYVRENRSPTESVPPHYQCKLCGVRAMSRLQNDEMLAHIKGWRHGFKYIKHVHPNKITCEEEDAERSAKIRKSIREIAAEVEQAEGRGQLEVILKEPCDVPAFKGLQSVIPKTMPPMGQGNGPRLGDRFPGEFPPQEGPVPNFKMGGRQEPGFVGYASRPDSTELDMGPRQFPDGMMGHHHGGGDGFGHNGRRDDFGMSGRQVDGPGRRFPDEFRGSQMGSSLLDGPTDRPGLMGSRLDPDSSSLQSTLLNFLNTFRIENESDAKIVQELIQKLTDVLIDYRLRSVSTVQLPSMSSRLNNSSVSSLGYSSPPSRMPGAGDHYSGGLSGSSRYSDGPSRFYN